MLIIQEKTAILIECVQPHAYILCFRVIIIVIIIIIIFFFFTVGIIKFINKVSIVVYVIT